MSHIMGSVWLMAEACIKFWHQVAGVLDSHDALSLHALLSLLAPPAFPIGKWAGQVYGLSSSSFSWEITRKKIVSYLLHRRKKTYWPMGSVEECHASFLAKETSVVHPSPVHPTDQWEPPHGTPKVEGGRTNLLASLPHHHHQYWKVQRSQMSEQG